MANKCTNCGYNCGEYDIFCSQCGMKLEQNSSQETINTDILDDSLNKFSIFENIKKNISENKQFTSFNSNAVNFFENNILHFVGILLIIAFALVTVLYFVLNSQGNHRIELQYKNLINNPQQIPELKEPANLVEFVDNLDKNHKFMSLYLNHSDDSVEKKEQIFASFINEIEKLPHLSNENLIKDEKDKCFKITSNSQAKTCSSIANKQLKDIGVVSYPYGNSYYLFADYEFIYDKYASHLSNEFQRYLKYKAKYTKV